MILLTCILVLYQFANSFLLYQIANAFLYYFSLLGLSKDEGSDIWGLQWLWSFQKLTLTNSLKSFMPHKCSDLDQSIPFPYIHIDSFIWTAPVKGEVCDMLLQTLSSYK